MKYSTIKLNIAESAKVTGQTKVYQNKNAFPAGDTTWEGIYAFAQDSDRLYLHTGTGWHNIAIINTNPIWETQPSASYDLATDATAYKNGTETTVSLAARDSEGATIQWSYVADSAFNNMAHIAQDSSVFTIEPKTEDSAGQAIMPQGSVTFKASDGVNIISAVSTFTLSFDASVEGSEQTSLLIKAVGDDANLNAGFDDISTSNQTISKAGNPALGTFSPFNSGGFSMYFDGTDDVVTYPDHADWALGGSDWTIEFWLNPDHHRDYDTVCAIVGTLAIEQKTDGSLYIWMSSNGSSWDIADTSRISYSIPIEEWTHVAVVFDDTANTLKSYTNGTLTHTLSSLTGTMNNSSNELRIGAYSNNWWKGYISDFRWVKGSKVYTADFTTPVGALTAITNTKLLCNRAWMGLDASGNHTGSTVNTNSVSNASIVPFTPHKHDPWNASVHGGSIYFDGSDDLRINHSSLEYGQNDWTIEFWFYPTAAVNASGGDGLGLFHLGASANGGTGGNAVNLNVNPHYRFEGVGQGGWDANSHYNTKTANGYQWHHFAMVRDYSAGTRKAYLNGVEIMSRTSDTVDGSFDYLVIGRYYDSDAFFHGYITDFRYVIGATVYTGAFTPPSGPLTTTGGSYPSSTNITNPTASQTKLLLNNTEAKVYDNSGTMNIPLHGTAQSDTGNQKNSVPSLYFPGSSYAEIPASDALDFGTGDWTIEGWFSIAEGYYIWDMRIQNSATNQNLPALYWDYQAGLSGNPVKLYFAGGVQITSSTMARSTWTHVAVQRVEGKIGLYIDGVGDSETYADTNDYGPQRLRIGARGTDAPAQHILGYVSDFRVTKGVARYPFTPSKETLTTTKALQSGNTCTASNVKLLALTTATVTQDISSESHTITNVNSVTTSNFGPVAGMKSALFDSSDDEKLTIPDGAWKTWGANFTVECWVYANSWPTSANNYIFGDFNSGGSASSASIAFKTTNTGAFLFYANVGGLQAIFSASANTNYPDQLSLNRWYHLAVVRNSGNFYLFKDGKMINSNTSHTGTISDSSQVFAIGGPGAYHTQCWDGYISNFRVNNGQALYTNTFTPPGALTG